MAFVLLTTRTMVAAICINRNMMTNPYRETVGMPQEIFVLGRRRSLVV